MAENDKSFDLAVAGAQTLKEQDNLEWIQAWQRNMRRAFKGIVGGLPADRARNLKAYGRRITDDR